MSASGLLQGGGQREVQADLGLLVLARQEYTVRGPCERCYNVLFRPIRQTHFVLPVYPAGGLRNQCQKMPITAGGAVLRKVLTKGHGEGGSLEHSICPGTMPLGEQTPCISPPPPLPQAACTKGPCPTKKKAKLNGMCPSSPIARQICGPSRNTLHGGVIALVRVRIYSQVRGVPGVQATKCMLMHAP